MAKCPICGQMLDWIEVGDGGRVPDDCERCGPRGYDVAKCGSFSLADLDDQGEFSSDYPILDDDMEYDEETEDEDDDGPEPCYQCGAARNEYTGCLCDTCRTAWEKREEKECGDE